jgi:hypothetical protein
MIAILFRNRVSLLKKGTQAEMLLETRFLGGLVFGVGWWGLRNRVSMRMLVG